MDQNWLRHPVVSGAISGWVTAALIDVAAFRKWQSFAEARDYNWNLAFWRWFQGAVYGAITGLGITVAD